MSEQTVDASEVCRYCQRPIRFLLQGWGDDTRDPYYCPKALNLSHRPVATPAPEATP